MGKQRKHLFNDSFGLKQTNSFVADSYGDVKDPTELSGALRGGGETPEYLPSIVVFYLEHALTPRILIGLGGSIGFVKIISGDYRISKCHQTSKQT